MHEHNLFTYGEPYDIDGVLYQRFRCTVCGGNTFYYPVESK